MTANRYEVRSMAGNCLHGGARTGTRWHAVLVEVNGPSGWPVVGNFLGKAVCGRSPSIQWSDAAAREVDQPTTWREAVTCPECLRRLSAGSTRGGRRVGAGRPSNAKRGLEVRSRTVALKLTEGEYEALVALADGDGEDVSSWVREVVFAAVGRIALVDPVDPDDEP